MTVAMVQTKQIKCVMENIVSALNRNSNAEMANAYPVGGGVIMRTIAVIIPTKTIARDSNVKMELSNAHLAIALHHTSDVMVIEIVVI